MTYSRSLQRLSAFVSCREVVLVCGLYKSGTSLAVAACERVGLHDVSRATNPYERGYGLSQERYLTRECLRVRRLNDRLLEGQPRKQMIDEIRRFLGEFDSSIVLKDPRFAFTLRDWAHAASSGGRELGLVFTRRPKAEVREAWEAAPYTQKLLAGDFLRAQRAGLAAQRLWCRRTRVPWLDLSLAQLREAQG